MRFLCRGKGGERGPSERGPLWVSPNAVGTAGNGACPAGAPFLGKKWGKEPQREEVLPSGLPSLVGLCGGRLYVSLVTWPAALTVKGP